MAVSNLNPPIRKMEKLEFNDEEKRRLVNYMSTLIEMDQTIDKNATNET